MTPTFPGLTHLGALWTANDNRPELTVTAGQGRGP
jgi:hypothetical protein